MAVLNSIRRGHYQDSMKLMRISGKLAGLRGVKNASAVMATEANLKTLEDMGLLEKTPVGTGANDLIVAVSAETEEAARNALGEIDSLLSVPSGGAAETSSFESFDEAANSPGAEPNIALISVPGEFAKLEVSRAMRNNMHTFLFSDNVSVEEEVELKRRAAAKGLMMMGPGCGTAIVNGAGLGFANVVRRGPVGVVAAAGTGMQEVTSLVHNWGLGVSHGIGVGGRDLSEEVGGLMATEAVKMLQRDRDTEIILLVSKPASAGVVGKVIRAARAGEKPLAMCLFGGAERAGGGGENVFFTDTLEELSLLAVNVKGEKSRAGASVSDSRLKRRARGLAASMNPSQKYVRGLFSGGTLCYEAQKILTSLLGKIHSNAPLSENCRLEDSGRSRGHSCVDLGEEEFTSGRPHPMIDSTTRSERIIREAKDPRAAVILLDVVLGHGSAPDPAGDLLPSIRRARDIARGKNRSLCFVAHVCGTDSDPQNLASQEEKLRKNGVITAETNAQASRIAGWVAGRTAKRGTVR